MNTDQPRQFAAYVIPAVLLALIAVVAVICVFYVKDDPFRGPTKQEIRDSGTFADLKADNGLWRDWYAYHQGSPQEFSSRAREFKYRPLYGGRIVDVPQDRDKLNVTVIGRDFRRDPASQHLRNMFRVPGHFLDELRRNSHYREIESDRDPVWGQYLSEFIGEAPALMVQPPADKSTRDGRERRSAPIILAWGANLSTNPDVVAWGVQHAIRNCERCRDWWRPRPDDNPRIDPREPRRPRRRILQQIMPRARMIENTIRNFVIIGVLGFVLFVCTAVVVVVALRRKVAQQPRWF